MKPHKHEWQTITESRSNNGSTFSGEIVTECCICGMRVKRTYGLNTERFGHESGFSEKIIRDGNNEN